LPCPSGGNPSFRRGGGRRQGLAALRAHGLFRRPFVDAARPLILLDTFGWPAVYERHKGTDFTAPNLDIRAYWRLIAAMRAKGASVSFHRSAAASEWLLIDHECPVADDGLLGVSGRVWSEDGGLLATGIAQLCCIPLPDDA